MKNLGGQILGFPAATGAARDEGVDALEVPLVQLAEPARILLGGLDQEALVAVFRRDLCRRVDMDEIDDPAPGGFLLVVPQSGAAGCDARIPADAGHLGEDQTGAADRARSVVHQVEIGRHALPGRVHAHRRYHGAIGELHLAQAPPLSLWPVRLAQRARVRAFLRTILSLRLAQRARVRAFNPIAKLHYPLPQ